MKLKELAQNLEICTLNDSLKKTAEIMQQSGFDAIPLVNEENEVVGVITKDNICEAIAKFDRKTSLIKNCELAFENVIHCKAKENVSKVFKQLAKKRVKYAVFTSQKDKTIAIISLPNILSRAAVDKKIVKKAFRVMGKINKPLPLILSEVSSLS